ncbi:MAG: DNA polymerase III subunit delta, partial [Erysipelotrichaceae bacterium]
ANRPLDETANQALLAYLERPMPSTHLIFSCVCEKLDSRKKLVKQALQYCKHEAFAPLEEREIKQVMDRKLKPYLQVLSEKSIQHIYQSIGKDLESFERFLEKLALQGDEIDDATIFFLLPRKLEDDVFELMSALLQKNRTKAFSLLQDFASNNIEPIQLIGILASQLRFIFQVLHLYQSGLNETEITSELGVHPYRVKLAVKNRRDISSDRALYYLHELSGLDQKIKHGKIEKRLGLELFFIQALG